MGTASISLEDFLSPESNLALEKWLELAPSSNTTESKPIGLRVAISVTIPSPAPHILHMVPPHTFLKRSCLFPLPVRIQLGKSWTRIIDEGGNLVLRLQMRDLKKPRVKQECRRRALVGITEAGESCTLAEFAESEWSIVNSPWSLKLPNTNSDDDHLLEMTGPRTVRLFSGARLDYELRRCEKHKVGHHLEHHLITAVEFSAEDPYGRAVAFLDLKSGTVKVKEEWFLMPAFILTFILGDIKRKEGCNSLIFGGRKTKLKAFSNKEVSDCAVIGSETNLAPSQEEMEVKVEAAKENAFMSAKGGACGGSCGGGCGSGCGNAARTVESGGCEGSGCGNMAKSGACGGCGSSGCGNMVKCGGSGGGRGNKLVNASDVGNDFINALPDRVVNPGNEMVV